MPPSYRRRHFSPRGRSVRPCPPPRWRSPLQPSRSPLEPRPCPSGVGVTIAKRLHRRRAPAAAFSPAAAVSAPVRRRGGAVRCSRRAVRCSRPVRSEWVWQSLHASAEPLPPLHSAPPQRPPLVRGGAVRCCGAVRSVWVWQSLHASAEPLPPPAHDFSPAAASAPVRRRGGAVRCSRRAVRCSIPVRAEWIGHRYMRPLRCRYRRRTASTRQPQRPPLSAAAAQSAATVAQSAAAAKSVRKHFSHRVDCR